MRAASRGRAWVRWLVCQMCSVRRNAHDQVVLEPQSGGIVPDAPTSNRACLMLVLQPFSVRIQAYSSRLGIKLTYQGPVCTPGSNGRRTGLDRTCAVEID